MVGSRIDMVNMVDVLNHTTIEVEAHRLQIIWIHDPSYASIFTVRSMDPSESRKECIYILPTVYRAYWFRPKVLLGEMLLHNSILTTVAP